MQTGTQLHAPEGFETLRKGSIYHLLRSDHIKERVLLLEFQKRSKSTKKPLRKDATDDCLPAEISSSPSDFRPVLHYLSRFKFESAIDESLIAPCTVQQELPPWFDGMSTVDLRTYALPRKTRTKSHSTRIDEALMHLWPLVKNLDQVLAAESPDAVINAHARTCKPAQNETRMRRSFYAYVCFGFSRWALHYSVHRIGRWSRIGNKQKLGRPSRLYGANHGHGTNDPEVIDNILKGYRRFAGPGQHLSHIYRRTLQYVFGCVTQTDATGRKSFIHPAGKPFPSLGQFAYRVAQAFPLEARQTYKFGHSRVRNRLMHSQGRFAESVGNLMERTEQDAYCCEQVALGYLPNSHLPPLWVVRIRCIASGMLVGVGFSVGGETAAAYRMAQFCAAIDKCIFAQLFGISLSPADWPSIGISPHVINDRGPGSTAKADAFESEFQPIIKEGAPSYAGQSKASIETLHPKSVKLEGRPTYRETRLSIPQLAIQELLRAVADNHCIDITDRISNEALAEHLQPTPVTLWNYLSKKGRNYGICMGFEEAVRTYLDPITVTVRDDAVYFKDARFDSASLQQSGALQKAHNLGRYTLQGFMLSVCVRHLWIDVGGALIQVDATLSIRDDDEQLYLSVNEVEQLQQIRRDEKLALQAHKLAARAEYEEIFKAHTGQDFEQSALKSGRTKRSKANSVKERQESIGYLRAGGRR